MGSTFAQELVDSNVQLEQQIYFQLVNNHYPPVPSSMVKICVDAIDSANEGDWDKEIELPEGVLWKGKTKAPAYAIIESHHLDFWIIESELD